MRESAFLFKTFNVAYLEATFFPIVCLILSSESCMETTVRISLYWRSHIVCHFEDCKMAFISTLILIPGDLVILIFGLYVRLPSYIF